jgi:hypothetical protein
MEERRACNTTPAGLDNLKCCLLKTIRPAGG